MSLPYIGLSLPKIGNINEKSGFFKEVFSFSNFSVVIVFHKYVIIITPNFYPGFSDTFLYIKREDTDNTFLLFEIRLLNDINRIVKTFTVNMGVGFEINDSFQAVRDDRDILLIKSQYVQIFINKKLDNLILSNFNTLYAETYCTNHKFIFYRYYIIRKSDLKIIGKEKQIISACFINNMYYIDLETRKLYKFRYAIKNHLFKNLKNTKYNYIHRLISTS